MLLAALALVGLFGAITPPASAHGGETVFLGEVGPFQVEVVDEVLEDTGLLYTLTLRDLSTGLPVADADVTVTATSADAAVGPLTANRFANAFQVLIADDGVEEWIVSVSIDAGPGRTAAFEHPLAGAGASFSSPWWTATPIVVVAWTLPILGIYVFIRAGRGPRKRSRADI